MIFHYRDAVNILWDIPTSIQGLCEKLLHQRTLVKSFGCNSGHRKNNSSNNNEILKGVKQILGKSMCFVWLNNGNVYVVGCRVAVPCQLPWNATGDWRMRAVPAGWWGRGGGARPRKMNFCTCYLLNSKRFGVVF